MFLSHYESGCSHFNEDMAAVRSDSCKDSTSTSTTGQELDWNTAGAARRCFTEERAVCILTSSLSIALMDNCMQVCMRIDILVWLLPFSLNCCSKFDHRWCSKRWHERRFCTHKIHFYELRYDAVMRWDHVRFIDLKVEVFMFFFSLLGSKLLNLSRRRRKEKQKKRQAFLMALLLLIQISWALRDQTIKTCYFRVVFLFSICE